MGFDQKGDVVLKICRGQNNRWEVVEEGMPKPLATFDEESDAVNYANDLARTKQGTRVEHRT